MSNVLTSTVRIFLCFPVTTLCLDLFPCLFSVVRLFSFTSRSVILNSPQKLVSKTAGKVCWLQVGAIGQAGHFESNLKIVLRSHVTVEFHSSGRTYRGI
jgi:hypothetical protein